MRVARIAILACVATVSLSAQDANAPTKAGSGTSHPRLLKEVVPAYPRIAFSARISGDVVIGAVINEAGRLADTMLDRSVPLLDAAALDAVRQWQFEPPIVNGRAGRLATTITVRFVIYDAEAPPPPAGRTASPSGMPADFAVVYEYGCKPGLATGHVFTLGRAPEAIFTVATHNLEPVYRQLSESGLLLRTAGLRVWQEPAAARATVSADGVTLTVPATMGFLCSDQVGSPLYAVSVRSDGTWRRLWPPQIAELIPLEHEQQVNATRALIQQLLERQ